MYYNKAPEFKFLKIINILLSVNDNLCCVYRVIINLNKATPPTT